ncbi:WSC domain protein, putative [Talaromyces stipitatus ATCC 10500]|uniref:WSC domain protein, putative n=1 Tax=Talaromyces stipitatus (strain ATCC 10500 / CBS 375.48 / QM 6759 / NRRL 1006) TaxID=441959 RepID=B8M3T2_TALSN|nr:WSC domain protein, putative [Talaromyces stipitatus ATCC 10500]EED20675.1 WSC domain protein, putative [Talaromyces stipitatus ATCC 10500]
MKSTSALLTGFLATLWAASPTNAFFRMPCPGRLVDERADPIVSPGAISGHVHAIAGGNGFGFNMTYEDARASSCSSCPIKADLSNYWVPHLYYRAQNGTFVQVPVSGDGKGNLGGITVYYLQRPGANNDPLKAFPEGFRMLAGDPFQRNFTGDFAAQAISYACLDYSGGGKPETNEFPDYNCPDGLRAQVFFPSCWDGKNLDSPDHKSHVSYPISGAYNNGVCPDTHPVHLVSIFYEIIFQTNLFADQWWDTKQPFVWAMGDPTGYGFHGDFVNGWNIDTLQYAVDHCLNDSGNISDCLAEDGSEFFDLFDNQVSQFCTLPDFVDEVVGPVVDNLPGCNPVTWGPEHATPGKCEDEAVISDEMLANYYTDVTQSLGWEYYGCAFDDISTRTLNGPNESKDEMTVEKCISFCSDAGYSYAGLEYSTQCYCGNSIPTDKAPISGVVGGCLFPCAGNSTEMCGGSAALSVYHNCAGGSCKNANIGVIEGAASSPANAAPAPGTNSAVATGKTTVAAGAGTGGTSATTMSGGAVSSKTTSAGASSITSAATTTVPAAGGHIIQGSSTITDICQLETVTVTVQGPAATVTVTAYT